MNFYPFHIGDYAAHTRHLSLIEDLAYRRLIDLYYLGEGELVGDAKVVAKKIGMSDFSSEVEYVLDNFFEKTENGYANKRCDEEISKYHLKADSARKANRAKMDKKTALKSELKSEPSQNVTNNQEPITSSERIDKSYKGSRWQKGLALPATWVEYCRTKRPDLNPKEVFESFTDYWISVAGSKGVKLDWDATWRTWVRSQRSNPKQPPTSNQFAGAI